MATSKAQQGGSSASSQSSKSGEMLEKWFYDQLRDIYYAEKAITKALPKMRKNATSEDLQAVLEEHLDTTEQQIERLNQCFESLGKRAMAKKCQGMDGLIAEGEESIEETKDDSFTRDVAIITSAQKVEHYEICAYGTLAQVARTMGKNDIAKLLEQTLQEEKDADKKLTMIAENNINEQAMRESR